MDGLVARAPERAIIDEVRRVRKLSLPLKFEVDRRRTPGRFLLTGSANILLLPRIADSLAERMGSIRLHPMARCEIERREPQFLRGGGGQRGAPTVARLDRRPRSRQSTRPGARTAPRPPPHSGHAVPGGVAASSYPHDLHRPCRSRQTPRAARTIRGKEIVASTIIVQALRLMPRPGQRTRVGTTLRGGWGSVMPRSPAAHSAPDAERSWPSTVSLRKTRSCSARLFQT